MSKFSFVSAGSRTSRAPVASSTGQVRHVALAPEAQGMELEFVFVPTTGAADGSCPPRAATTTGNGKTPTARAPRWLFGAV